MSCVVESKITKFVALIVTWLWYTHYYSLLPSPVLSNKGKRVIYDAGMFGFIEEDDDEGFVDFMQEMVLTMQKVKHQGEKCMLEDFQGMLMDTIAESDGERSESGLCWSSSVSVSPKKKTRLL
ncbi:hypothetical protein PIB30_045884 [Stylosanthes scabra]|uniref:Uncharacterized protein n=1 Tax=Stylosanthes scabra TaxID=79078 RepID=A0ABU6SH31_9FABA|nr:hypothetical protein [Stylosanthes scabra]